MKKFYLFQRVIYNRMECRVTNASIARGKYYQVSPIGNGCQPAKYFTVGYWEIETPKNPTQ